MEPRSGCLISSHLYLRFLTLGWLLLYPVPSPTAIEQAILNTNQRIIIPNVYLLGIILAQLYP